MRHFFSERDTVRLHPFQLTFLLVYTISFLFTSSADYFFIPLGCYSSICEDGTLKILLGNATLTCQTSGQMIEVALVKDEWLHEGSIVCPPCNKFCDDCSNADTEEPISDVNESLKQTVEEAICRAEPRVNMLLGFLQDLGFDPNGFS